LIDFGANATAVAMALGPDGKIVVTGEATRDVGTGTLLEVARLNTDGTLDTSFNGTGMETVSFDAGGWTPTVEAVSGVVVQPDDKIVLVGQVNLPGAQDDDTVAPADAAVARLNADGGLDTSFNGSGELLYNDSQGSTSDDSANGVALEGTEIVIVGTSIQLPSTDNSGSSNPSVSELTVTRLNADGTFDASFNGSGEYAMSLNQGGNAYNTLGAAVTVLSDGSLLVGGRAWGWGNSGGLSGALLAELTPGGAPDTGFGTDGVALLGSVGLESRLLVQSDSKVLFATNYGVARTTAPEPAVVTTTTTASGTGEEAQASGVAPTFNPSLASDLSAIVVRSLKGKKAIKIKKGGITYDAATQTLIIRFARKTAVGKGFRLQVTPGEIAGADGQVLFHGAGITILIAPSTS
jgi:uncharacterized delta-60 repeat protein